MTDATVENAEEYKLVIGEGLPANMADVDASVAELHRRMACAEDATVVPASRTVLFNLVAYPQSERDVAGAMGAAAEVVSLRPCRAIVVGRLSDRDSAPSAEVDVVCGITERGERRLCGEVIKAWAHPDYLVSLVNPLLVGDVPLYVWLPDHVPPADNGFRGLLESADAAIVDSRDFTNPATELPQILDLRGPSGHARAVEDLAWVSILPWREMIAGHFDPPGLRHFLGTVREVIISHSDAGVPCCALLLAGWLVDRLGLRVTGHVTTPDALTAKCRMGDRDVVITLKRVPSAFDAGGIEWVDMKCESGDGEAVFHSYRVSETELASDEVCSGVCYPPRTITLSSGGTGYAVAQAVDQPRLDPRYDAALKVACSLVA